MKSTDLSPAHSVDPGQKLRQARERLSLRFRDVEEASEAIARQRGSEQFHIGLSRLSDIENKGIVPSIYRLYTLSAVYRVDYKELLAWFGIDLAELPADAASVPHRVTHPFQLEADEASEVLAPVDSGPAGHGKTAYLGQVRNWGRVPLALVSQIADASRRYAFVGLDDWFMYPLIRPGSFLEVDQTRNRVANAGWLTEWERPIYLVEHRHGFRCAWCNLDGRQLVLQPHPASQMIPEIYKHPEEAEVIGQVTGLATRFHPARRRHTRFEADQV